MKYSAEIEKTDNGVVIKPLYSSDQEQLSKMKQNTQYSFEVKQPRNVKFHRKFMALMNLGFENQENIKSFDHYRKLVVMKAGFYETIETKKGTIYLPDSISFSNMDQTKFEDVFNRVLDVICTQLDTAPELIKKQLEHYM